MKMWQLQFAFKSRILLFEFGVNGVMFSIFDKSVMSSISDYVVHTDVTDLSGVKQAFKKAAAISLLSLFTSRSIRFIPLDASK